MRPQDDAAPPTDAEQYAAGWALGFLAHAAWHGGVQPDLRRMIDNADATLKVGAFEAQRGNTDAADACRKAADYLHEVAAALGSR